MKAGEKRELKVARLSERGTAITRSGAYLRKLIIFIQSLVNGVTFVQVLSFTSVWL
jgi:hypothetical protein